MNLNIEFREKFEKQLQANKFFFERKSIELLEDCVITCFKLIADNISVKNYPYKIDLDSSKKCIIESLNEQNSPVLQIRKLAYNDNRYNEIVFSIKKENQLIFNSEEEIKYSHERKRLEQECEKEFWLSKDIIERYNQMPDFDCFNDIQISEAELSKYQNSSKYFYNVEGWLNYIFELVKRTFPEFVFNEAKSSTKVLRFLKPLKNGLFFGFEYDISVLAREIKTDAIRLPYYFNIILLNDSFKKSVLYKDYILNYNENILSLGNLGNPFFYEPCFPLLGFQAVEMHYNKDVPSSFTYNYKRQFIQNNDGTFTLVHPKIYGEKLKKHAFFYMEALKYSSKGYLEYIEKSLIESC